MADFHRLPPPQIPWQVTVSALALLAVLSVDLTAIIVAYLLR